MANNVYNPAIPYVGSIPALVGPGFSIHIKGSSLPTCNRFAVNLQCGPSISPRDDVLLHIGVDFMRNIILRNSIHNMNWGPEESQQSHFPLNRGAPFEIMIRCESVHFNISVNGQHFASFEHRIVYHRATHITIDGDIFVASIEYNSGRCSPNVGNMYPPAPQMNPGMHTSSAPYPVSPSMHTSSAPYPVSPSMPNRPYPTSQYPMGGPTPMVAPPMFGGAHAPHMNSSHIGGHGQHKEGVIDGMLKKIGVGGVAGTGALAATAGLGYLGSKKAWKAQKKARKKALKFGIPLAGAGLGAYAISKAFRSSSSSSSSSDEE